MRENIIISCPHYWRCSHPFYTGKCLEKCIELYKRTIDNPKLLKGGEG